MIEAGLQAHAARQAVRLEIVTVIWMALEAALAIGAGVAARSVVLTAFGVDSVVELLSGTVLAWRMSVEAGGAGIARVDRVERRATMAAAVLLVLLCAYVVISSAGGLLLGIRPDGSVLGIVVAAVAVIGMPLLAWAKRRVNRRLQSAALRADIAETVTCAYMAGVTLAGVALSMLPGAWWLQYVAALALLIWLVPETKEALEAAR
ncbi:MAG: cation transporter [Chloroflexi bacterium]|nr:MAG: cation transporter [Chloroflexota bacterium]